MARKELIKETTIDIEPRWNDLVPLFCEWLQSGNEEQRKIAKEHIEVMAQITDKYRQTQKRGKTMLRIPQPKAERVRYSHGYNVGDILECSWGYDQTNVDFYQVIDTTSKQLLIRKINSVEKRTGDMIGEVLPLKNNFSGKAFRRKTHEHRGEWFVRINEYQFAGKWDGKPQRVSHYA